MKTQFHPQRGSVMQSLPPKIQKFKCSEKTSFKTQGTQIQRHSEISTPCRSRLQSKEHSHISYECARHQRSFHNAVRG